MGRTDFAVNNKKQQHATAIGFIESIIAFTRTFEQFCPLQTKRSHHYHQQIDKYSNVFAFQSKIISQSIAVAAIFFCCKYHLLVLIVEVLLGNFGLIQLFGLTPAMIVHLFICCKTTVWSLLSFALCIIMNSCKYQTKLVATIARPNKRISIQFLKSFLAHWPHLSNYMFWSDYKYLNDSSMFDIVSY